MPTIIDTQRQTAGPFDPVAHRLAADNQRSTTDAVTGMGGCGEIIPAGGACSNAVEFGGPHAGFIASAHAPLPDAGSISLAGDEGVLPEMVVSKTVKAPVIDGKMDEGEWDRAPSCTAWVGAFNNELNLVQSTAWITYDDQFVYVCIKNNRGPKGDLLQKRARKTDDAAIVFDPSNEIWLTPPSAPQATYQTLFNPYPAVFDAKMIPSVGYTAMSWSGKWEIASSETKDYWIVEAKAPIKSFGPDHIADGSQWRGLFCGDIGDGYGFRAWAPGGGFSDIPRHGYMNFKDNSAVFQFLEMESIFTGKCNFPMSVTGPAKGSSEVAVTVRFGAGAAAGPDDVVKTHTVTVADGKKAAFAIEADLTGAKLAAKKIQVDQPDPNNPGKTIKVPLEVPAGWCEVTAKTADGVMLYHQSFPFVINGWVRKAPTAIRTTPYETAFGLGAFYAPLSKQLIVKVDRYYMTNRQDVAGGTAVLKDATGKVAAQRKLAPFYFDYSEFPMDLTQIDVPVETEADWAVSKGVTVANNKALATVKANEAENKKIEAENKKTADENAKTAAENAKLAAQNKPPKPLKELKALLATTMPLQPVGVFKAPALFDLEIVLNDKDGKELARTSYSEFTAVKTKKPRTDPANQLALMGYEFEFTPSHVGESDKVIPPWTPMKWSAGEVSMWNKTYKLNGLGLAEKIVNSGQPQLTAMKMIATVDGQDVEIKPGEPVVKRQSEAELDLTGTGSGAGLVLNVDTRVEFDGYVLNTMKIAPAGAAKVDRLSLVVTMPAEEAPCFVTTAGGWSAYHGWTPDKWDSRETALGSMVGNFVPYVFFTDSERGFCWFADTMKGWKLDPNAATQEMKREGGEITFRVNFVTAPGPVTEPTSITYGWICSPQKPQPANWRGYQIGQQRPFPQGRCVFWADADWAVLWPYYSSPYPWDYEKSKALLHNGAIGPCVNCVGNIAHAIARYVDAKGRDFSPVVADWGSTPGDPSNGNVCRTKASNDFQLWHWDQWMKKSGLAGLYFDENYLSEEWNYLVGNAYLLPDERVQPGYSYIGERDLFKRLRYVFHANGKTGNGPNVWLHTTGGQPVYSWLPDVSMEGENVEPANADNDYIDCLPAGRIRAIGMGRNLGTAPFVMCQAGNHFVPAYGARMVDQFVGWLALHDVLPQNVPFQGVLFGEMQLWQDDYKFLPYWKSGLGIESLTKDVVASAHVRPGQANLWIMNLSQADLQAAVRVDLKKLGLAGPARMFDAETGEAASFKDDTLTVSVPRRFWRCIRIVASQEGKLDGTTTFYASFDQDAQADASMGSPSPRVPMETDIPQAAIVGTKGRAVLLDKALSYFARHNIPADGEATIRYDLKLAADSSGTLLALGDVTASLEKGKVVVRTTRSRNVEVKGKDGSTVVNVVREQALLAEQAVALDADASWQAMTVKFAGTAMTVQMGSVTVQATLDAPLTFKMERGGRIYGTMPRADNNPAFTIGPIKGAAIDELKISK